MSGYYGNYGAPPMGYQGVYDPTQPPPPPQSYGQPTIGFAFDMPPNAPYCPQPQPSYSPYPNSPPQNYGAPYPNSGGNQPNIGFNIDSDPSAPPDHIGSADVITETKKQGEEAGFWTTDSSGYRVYNYYSDNSNKEPSNYSHSSSYNTAYSYGPSNPANNQGRKSPYSQNTGGDSRSGAAGLGSGWTGASSDSSSRRDSSEYKSKQRAPDIPTPSVRSSSSDISPRGGGSSDMKKKSDNNVALSADKAQTDTEYKSKLDKLAALMTDVSIDESDLADMRKKNDLHK